MSAYVETAEPPEGETWEPWYYAMCGDCDWESPNGYPMDEFTRALAEAKAHICPVPLPAEDGDAT